MSNPFLRQSRLPAVLPVVTDKMLREEAAAFQAYRDSEDAKKFKVKTQFGFSRYSTEEQAKEFAATLKEPYCILSCKSNHNRKYHNEHPRKVEATSSYAQQLIRAGWARNAAIANSQNLHRLSDKRMKEVEALVPTIHHDSK